jgi:hypothetical protein
MPTRVDYTTQIKDSPYIPLVVTDAPFGAKGDGSTDNFTAIQAALTAGAGREVHFPYGNYLVKVGEYTGFRVFEGTKITADRDTKITISTASGAAGQYSRVFQCMSADGCANVEFHNLIVDHQSSLNPYPGGGSTYIQTHRRNTIWWEGATGGSIIIDNLHVLNSVSSNDILINKNGSGGRAAYARVSNCRFTNMGGGAYTWDSSVIYGFADTMVVEGNFVEAGGYGLNQAYTGMEVYGQNLTVNGNIVRKYMTGALIGGCNVVASGNNFMTTVNGIQMVAIMNVTGDASLTTEGYVVTGNKCRIVNNETALVEYSRLEAIGFYALVDSSVTEINGVNISNNDIQYDVFASFNSDVDANSHAIGVFTTSPAIVFRNCKIAGNTIQNSPYGAICNATNAMRAWSIEHNLIYNAGCMPSATLTQYLYPIRINSTDCDGLIIKDNLIVDPNATSIFKYAIQLSGCLFPHTELSSNSVQLWGATQTAFISKYSYTGSPIIRDTLGLVGSSYNFIDPLMIAASTALTIPVGGIDVQNGGGSFVKPVSSGIQLLTNPTFTGGTGWTAGPGWAFGSGAAVATAATSSAISQAGVVAQGHHYLIGFTIGNWTPNSGAVVAAVFGGSQSLGYFNANGTYSITATSLLVGTTFGFTTSPAAVTCNITNVSLYEILPTDGVTVGDSITALSNKLRVFGAIVTVGAQSVVGTGVSGQKGGPNGGEFTTSVTGTTTITITPGITAPNGWSVWAANLTTPANPFVQTARNATTATLAGVTNANDVIVWGCIGY